MNKLKSQCIDVLTVINLMVPMVFHVQPSRAYLVKRQSNLFTHNTTAALKLTTLAF